MKKNVVIWLLLLQFACSRFDPFSTIKVSDLNFGDQISTVELFVKGGITSQLTFHKLIIEKPGSILNGQKTVSIIDAVPYIISGFDTIRYALIDTLGSTFYRTTIPVKVELGKSYSLIIEYNNNTYRATDEMTEVDPFKYDEIVLPTINTNVTYQGMPDLIDLSLTKHEFGHSKANMWVWFPNFENNRYFKQGGSYLEYEHGTTYTHWASNPNAIFSFFTYHNGLGPFIETDTITTAKYSISDGYYQYLLAFFAETDWKQGEFATQPGNLPTNFSEGAAGYFFVSDMYEKQIIVRDLLELIEK